MATLFALPLTTRKIQIDRSWPAILGITVLLVLLFAPTMAGLAHDWWNDEDASYGMIVPPMALYIAWLRRRSTLAIPAESDGRGIWMVALGCLTFLIGRLGAEYFLTRSSFVIVLAGLIWTFWGRARLRSLSFPLILLVTMVPLPTIVYNLVGIPLQLLASDVSARLIQAFGGTIYRDGNILQLPGITLGVAEACSGLRSLASLTVAALMVGFLNCTRLRTRILLVALALPLAISMNILRVTGTAVLATYREEFAMGFYHSFSGWLVFLASFGLLLVLARILHKIGD